MVDVPYESDEKVDMPDFWAAVLAGQEGGNEQLDSGSIRNSQIEYDGPDSNVDADSFF